MSGGTFEHRDYVINEIADTIGNLAEFRLRHASGSRRDVPRSNDVVKLYSVTASLLRHLGNMVHHIDWFEASDTQETVMLGRIGEELEQLTKHLETLLGEYGKQP